MKAVNEKYGHLGQSLLTLTPPRGRSFIDNTSVVNQHPIYQELSSDEKERRKEYRDFVRGMLENKNAMKGEMEKQVVYGNEDFIGKITKKFKVEAIIKPKGRPKKDGE